jgi:protein-tyrosine phosphatase
MKNIRNFIKTNYATPKGCLRALLTNVEYALGCASAFTRPDLADVRRLVFICHGNINRSAFAHAVGEKGNIKCASFGLSTSTGHPAFPLAVKIAAELNCSLAHHRAVNITDFVAEPGDLYLVMELRHARRLVRQGFAARQVALLGYWSRPQRLHIHDPYEHGEDYFRTCFRLIQSAVENLTSEIHACVTCSQLIDIKTPQP